MNNKYFTRWVLGQKIKITGCCLQYERCNSFVPFVRKTIGSISCRIINTVLSTVKPFIQLTNDRSLSTKLVSYDAQSITTTINREKNFFFNEKESSVNLFFLILFQNFCKAIS